LTKNAQQQLVNNLKQELEAEYRNECVTKGGEGSAFTIHPGRVVTDCAEYSGSTSGYLRVEVLCDYCTGEKVDKILDLVEKYCNDECMASIAYCQKADLIYEGGWGGTVENYDKCGETLLECQSEGSSSSVGEDEQSSSSQELLSSDSHYSSFDAESSSSEEFGPESSDSGINSSSSDDGDNPSSSSGDEECGSGIGHCPLKEDTLGRNSPYDEIKCTYSKTPYLYDLAGTGECVTKWVEIANSSRKKNTQNAFVPPTLDPHDLNKMAFHFSCPQSIGLLSIPNENYNHLVVDSNIPYARTTGQFNDFYCYRTLEDCLLEKNEILMTRPEGFWCAPDYASDGYITMTDYGCSIIHPYENKTVLSGVNFHYTNEEGFSIYKLNGVLLSNTTEDLLFNKIRDAAKNAEMTISFLDDGTSVYPDIEAMDEACAKWQKRGDYNQSSSSEMESSSSEVKSSSSEELSSSSEESSSSVEESSSSYECSSSDCDDGISSSSQEEFSSSSDELVSSGSVDVEESSSSQQIESSSSEFVYSSSSDGRFVSDGDQVHSPDQIFNDGLDNMEPGSCYSLNPDRGTQYGWMNTDAKDSWWWREVDCESGEKVDRNRVGVCPGFPLDKVPSNPKRSCVAYDGRCYRCKSENSYVDCSQEWLWKWSFSEQNIGSWYAEVDCYNPRYEGNVAGCLESKGLYKASIGFDNIVDGFDDVVEISSSKNMMLRDE